MDPLEEQREEFEILESIYPDELTKISPTQFTIKLLLDNLSDRKHRLVLHVTYPPQYPEIAPLLDISVPDPDSDDEDENDHENSDSDDENQSPINLVESIQYDDDDLKVLLDDLIEEAEFNIGMPSIFALSSVLKDKAEELFNKKVDIAQKKYDEELMAREMEDQKKFNGTKVTTESFNEWRIKFREEMRIDEYDAKRLQEMHHGKLTGREIFEKGLSGDMDDELEELSNEIKNVEVK